MQVQEKLTDFLDILSDAELDTLFKKLHTGENLIKGMNKKFIIPATGKQI